ncbi:MAG: toll/interleukin-1 receptor domain-containing protein [Lachnospiraceae bacterium]|nr:toll/interleukin-1 receptor domain-containing protein [Lachnospiraceae bacterium]
MSSLNDVHYDAFISYRHSELDAFVAKNIHRKLESFKLPKSLRGKTKNGKTRIERVFRDVDELPLSDNLSEPINAALANSDFLITICTPRYLESRWCMKEIEVFLQTHDRDHILVVLAEDEPQNSFPRILTYEEVVSTDADGNTVKSIKELEPLAADTRGSNKKEILKAMDVAVIKLCAAMFGLNYDDLKQRHREQKIKRMAAVFGSIGTAVLFFAIFATVMLIRISRQNEVISEQNNELQEKNELISEQYSELQDKYAGSVADAADSLYGMGRRMDAVYSLRQVLPDSEADSPNAAALRVLYNTMNVYAVPEKFVPDRIYEGSSELVDFSVSQDGRYILINDDIDIRVFDIATGNLVREIKRTSEYAEYADFDRFYASFCGMDGLAVIDGTDVYYTMISSDERKEIKGINENTEFFNSPDGEVMFGFCDSMLFGYDEQGELLYEIDMKDIFGIDECYIVGMDFDGEDFLCNMSDNNDHYLLVAETETGRILTYSFGDGGAVATDLSGSELFTAIITFDEDTEKNITTISCDDHQTGESAWSLDIEGYTPYNMAAAGDCLYINDLNMVTVIDRYTGSIKETFPSGGEIICGWTEGDIYYYLTDEGRIFSNSEFCYGYEETDSFFTGRPEGRLSYALKRGGDLYLIGDRSGFAVRYLKEISEGAELLAYDYDFPYEIDDAAFDEIEAASGSGAALPDYAEYSDDKSYIAALYSDNTVKIYDRSSMEIKGVFRLDDRDRGLMDFYRSEMMECYVMSTYGSCYLLNDRFEVFCRIPARIIKEENDELTLWVSESGSEYYSVPYVGYDELIERTDEYLDGYEPSEAVRLRYSIQ